MQSVMEPRRLPAANDRVCEDVIAQVISEFLLGSASVPLTCLVVIRAKDMEDVVNQKTLNAKLRGHYQYYGRPTNYRSIRQFYRRVQCIWRVWLGRRTRGKRLTWERFKDILRQFPLLLPRITHAWAGAGSHT